MFWRPDLYAQAVSLQRAEDAGASAASFEPDRWPGVVSTAVARGRLHLLLRGADATHQLVTDGALVQGAPMAVRIDADDSFDLRMAAAQGFLRAVAKRRNGRRLARSRRSQRLIDALNAYDTWRAKGSYRAVAEQQYGSARVSAEPWKTSALRGAAIRVVRLGQSLVDGGYRRLLRRPDG